MAKKTGPKNLRIAIFFLLLVFFFISVSLLFKVFFLFKESKFDGENRFTIAVFQDGNASLISISPGEKSATFLKIEGPIEDKNVARLVSVGVDATISLEDLEINPDNMGSLFSKMAFSMGEFQTRLTPIDLFRLGLTAKNISDSSVNKIAFHTKDDERDIKSKVTGVFVDKKISSEGLRIEIVNASDTSGVANSLANLISNIGGNVILASTSDESESESKILYVGDASYTVMKLSRLLDIKTEKTEDRGISDVIIRVGKDKSPTTKF